jgi:hypothetical protein
MFGFTAVNRTIKAIDNYLDYLDECSLVFKSGVKNYLEGNTAEFNDNLKSITNLESTTHRLTANNRERAILAGDGHR